MEQRVVVHKQGWPVEAIKSQLDQSKPLQYVCNALAEERGVYLVGGSLRDFLLGRQPHELDLVVEGDPLAFAMRVGNVKAVHSRFNTTQVELPDGTLADIAMARSESYVQSGALPVVKSASIEIDLLRRDFTVNAVAFELATAKLVAVHDALEDLAEQQLRVLHEKSFQDDPTRLLRLVRYCARLNFRPEEQTKKLMQTAAVRQYTNMVSRPRIGNELRLLVCEKHAVEALSMLSNFDLVPDLFFHQDLFQQAVSSVSLNEEDRLLLLIAFAFAFPKQTISTGELKKKLAAYGYHAAEINAIIAVHNAPNLARKLMRATSPSLVDQLLQNVPVVAAVAASAYGAKQQVSQWVNIHSRVQLHITGQDLLDSGVPFGPDIGLRLRQVRNLVLDGAVSPGYQQELEAALADR